MSPPGQCGGSSEGAGNQLHVDITAVEVHNTNKDVSKDWRKGTTSRKTCISSKLVRSRLRPPWTIIGFFSRIGSIMSYLTTVTHT